LRVFFFFFFNNTMFGFKHLQQRELSLFKYHQTGYSIHYVYWG